LTAGAEARKDYELAGSRMMADLARSFDQAEITGELDYANRPIEPNLTDYLQEIGGAALQYKLGTDYLNSLQDYAGGVGGHPVGSAEWIEMNRPKEILKPKAPPLTVPLEDQLKSKLRQFVMSRGLQRLPRTLQPKPVLR